MLQAAGAGGRRVRHCCPRSSAAPRARRGARLHGPIIRAARARTGPCSAGVHTGYWGSSGTVVEWTCIWSTTST